MIACIHLSLFGSAFAQKPETTQRQDVTVTLPLLALSHDGKPLTDLNQNELELYEGKEERPIESMSRNPEAPAKIGFLVDVSNSVAGSLRALKWQNDPDPAGELLRIGDVAFVATFTQSHTLLCPLTSDLEQVKTALHTAFTAPLPTGVTALSDAIFWASSEELSAQSDHKALIVLSDMGDNRSQHTWLEAIAPAQRFGIAIYPISLREIDSTGHMPAISIAGKTGGAHFTVYKLDDLKKAFRNIRTDIDNTYTLEYRSNSTGPSHIKLRCTRKGVNITAPDQIY